MIDSWIQASRDPAVAAYGARVVRLYDGWIVGEESTRDRRRDTVSAE